MRALGKESAWLGNVFVDIYGFVPWISGDLFHHIASMDRDTMEGWNSKTMVWTVGAVGLYIRAITETDRFTIPQNTQQELYSLLHRKYIGAMEKVHSANIQWRGRWRRPQCTSMVTLLNAKVQSSVDNQSESVPKNYWLKENHLSIHCQNKVWNIVQLY